MKNKSTFVNRIGFSKDIRLFWFISGFRGHAGLGTAFTNIVCTVEPFGQRAQLFPINLHIPRSGQGLLKPIEKFESLSVFRLNLLINKDVGRQPPEICIFSSHFLEFVKRIVKSQFLEYQIRNVGLFLNFLYQEEIFS